MGRQNTHFMFNIVSTMENPPKEEQITKPLLSSVDPVRLLLGVVIISILLGAITGFIMAGKDASSKSPGLISGAPKTAQQDSRTFRDFAEGMIRKKPEPADPSEYVEGTHLLEREGAVSVALTSSVVDLSQYEGKKVKVFGETQKAIKEGWLMDVGKVEELK